MRWKLGLAGALIVLVASLLAVNTASSTSGDRSETVWLYADANESAETFVPVSGEVPTEDAPPEIGARNISRDDLFVLGGSVEAPTKAGDSVGRNDIECTFVEVDEATFSVRLLCSGVIDMFGQGTISWQAVLLFSEATEGQPFHVAITGGTGAFEDAGGEILVHPVPLPAGADEEALADTVYEVRLLHLDGV